MKSEKFKAYKEEVVAAFQKKHAEAEEPWLVELNRGKLRQRSVELVEKGVHPNDYRAVSDFLEMKADDRDFLTAVNKSEQDDYQGLLQFLKIPSRNPSTTTVEFLSWMIDFPKRPYSEYLNGNTDKELGPVKGPRKNPIIKTGEPSDRRQVDPLYLWISGLSFLIMFVGFIWWFWPTNDCMYWNDDHYVESPCNVPKLDTPLFALDRAKLRSFRRIKKIDTISYYAVGKFGFTRVGKDNRIEIFTTGGVHPLYPDKKLKEVTDYIVNTCNPNLQRH